MSITVLCRDAEPAEVPTSAARLTKAAAEHGWFHRCTYAQAEIDNKVIESVAVRLHAGILAGYGLWVGGKFAFAYVTSTISAPRRVGARELSAFVKSVAK